MNVYLLNFGISCLATHTYNLSLTPVVTGRRATPTANEGIGDGEKVADFSQLFWPASTFRVDALVMLYFSSFFVIFLPGV